MIDLPELPIDAPVDTPVTMDSPLGDALTFHSMGGFEGLSVPFHFELEVTSRRSDIDPSELLGQSVTVHLDLGQDGESTRHWNGWVANHDYLETRDDGISRYRLTVRPWIWQLGRCRNCRIFQNMSVPEIVERVFRDRGFTDFERKLFGHYDPREYVVQYRESDLAFVSRLLEREGIYYFHRHEDGKHTLVLADDRQAQAPVDGYKTLQYATDDKHRDQTIEYVRRWRAESQLEPVRYALADFDFTKPRVQLYAAGRVPDDAFDSEIDAYDYPGGFDSFTDANRYARLRLDQSRRDRDTWVGETNARGLTVGATFKLEDHPRSDQNRGYLVTSARIRLHRTDSTNGVESDEEPFACAFRASKDDVTFRSPLPRDKPTARGPQTATVVGPEGREIWTDEYGRVKVQFHWDRDGNEDDTSSCWVRVAQLWAGSGWGAQFVPRIGDEVVVAFLEADPDRPIIIGSVYNGANRPPFDLPSNETQSGIRTRSTPGGTLATGNEIRFEDLRGSEDLFIHAEGTYTTQVKRSQSVKVGLARTVSVGASDAVFVVGARTAEVGASDTTTVGGKSTLTVTGSRTLHVDGEYTAEMSSGSKMSFGGGLNVRVAGHAARQISGAQTEAVLGDAFETVQGTRMRSVGNDIQIVADRQSTTIGAEGRDGSGSETFVFGTYKVGTQKGLVLESAEEIVIRCGTTELHLTPTALEVVAETIKLNATKQALISGNGPSLHLGDDAQLTSKTIGLVSSGARLALGDEAKLTGSKVQLGSGSGSGGGSSASSADQSQQFSMTVVGADHAPLANRTYQLEVAGQSISGQTDSSGKITTTIPKDATSGRCTVWTGDFPEGSRITYVLEFGAIAGPSTPLGAQMRLRNLGYYHGTPETDWTPAAMDALLLFQRQSGLETTGKLDGPTVNQLSSVHP